jgi:UrcA family protein
MIPKTVLRATRLLPRLLAASALSIVAILGAAPAVADTTAEEVRTTTVNFADLNLSTAAGARVLYARLKAAAREVCDNNGELDLRSKLAARQCRKAALERSVSEAAQPMLTALHRGSRAYG